MEGLSCSFAFNGIQCFAYVVSPHAKQLQPQLTHARTETRLSPCGSRPPIKKAPFGTFKIWGKPTKFGKNKIVQIAKYFVDMKSSVEFQLLLEEVKISIDFLLYNCNK